MKVTDNPFISNHSMGVSEAVSLILSDAGPQGELERLAARIDTMQEVLTRFLTANIRTIDDLNLLAGWQRFDEVKE